MNWVRVAWDNHTRGIRDKYYDWWLGLHGTHPSLPDDEYLTWLHNTAIKLQEKPLR